MAMNEQILVATGGAAPAENFGARIIELAHHLAQWSEMPEGLMCTYFSPVHKAVAIQLREWMLSAGLEAKIDPVGNVIGRYPSAEPGAKTLILGSHYDTVANAGHFDGRLGILTALVVAEHLQRTGQRLPFHLEVIGFSEEEGVRFSAPYLWRGAMPVT